MALKSFSNSNNALNWAIKGLISVGSVRFLSLPITLATAIILGRFLAPEAYGTYSFSIALAELIALPVGLGLKGLIIRTVAQANKSKDFELIERVRLTSSYLAIFYFFTILLFSLTLFYLVESWSLPLIAALLLAPCFAFFEIYGSILQGLERSTYSQLFQVFLRPLVFFIFVVFLLWLGLLNLIQAYIIFFIASVLVFIFLYLSVRSSFNPTINVSRMLSINKKLKISYLSFLSIELVQFLSMNAGILFLGMTGDQVGSAGMQVARSTGLLVFFPVVAVEILSQPRLAQLVKVSDRIEFMQTYKESARVSLAASLLIGVPMCLFAEALLKITFGVEYVPIALDAMRIIIIARIIQA
jgi:O-antigen/teichoic acid export membrane protein